MVSSASAKPRRASLGPALAVVLFVILALVPAVAGLGPREYVLSLVTRIMISGLAAMALDILIGYGGMISFGHAAFVGIGAYAVAILSSFGLDDAGAQLLAALGGAALFALATGAISLRTRGAYFIMITLAFGQMLFFLFSALSAFGGDDGMSLPSRSLVFGAALFKDATALYYIAFAILLGFYIACRAMVASRFGRVLRGIAQNRTRMEAMGFSPYPYQLAAYVMAGMIASVAGFLLANQTAFVSPAYASWPRSGEFIFMAVLGGVRTLHGAILGAAAFTLMSEFLPDLTDHWKLIFGPILILAVIFIRGGLAGLLGRRA